jgi:hypothetical protein
LPLFSHSNPSSELAALSTIVVKDKFPVVHRDFSCTDILDGQGIVWEYLVEQATDGTAGGRGGFPQQNLLQNPKIPKMVDYNTYFTLFPSGIHTGPSKTCWKWLDGGVTLVLPTL